MSPSKDHCLLWDHSVAVVSLVELAVGKCCLMQGQINTCPVHCFQQSVESQCLVKTSCVLPWLKKTSESRLLHRSAVLWQQFKLQPWISLLDFSNSGSDTTVQCCCLLLLEYEICSVQNRQMYVPVSEVFTSPEQHVVWSLQNSPFSHDAGIKYCNANLVPCLSVWPLPVYFGGPLLNLSGYSWYDCRWDSSLWSCYSDYPAICYTHL